jgi:hypothetical protein
MKKRLYLPGVTGSFWCVFDTQKINFKNGLYKSTYYRAWIVGEDCPLFSTRCHNNIVY